MNKLSSFFGNVVEIRLFLSNLRLFPYFYSETVKINYPNYITIINATKFESKEYLTLIPISKVSVEKCGEI